VNRLVSGRLGRRGLSLLFFGVLDLIYAFSLANPDAESRKGSFLTAVAGLAPLWVWSVMWAIVGVLCLIHAFRRDDRIGWTGAIFLKVIWAATCLIAWIAGGADRGYVSAAIWAAAAGFVWVISGWSEAEGRSVWNRRSSPPS
jgi:hypothetical protein